MTKYENLNMDELRRLKNVFDELESNALIVSGLVGIDGAFSTTKVKSYTDKKIQIQLTFGVQAGGDDDYKEVEDYTLNRQTLEFI